VPAYRFVTNMTQETEVTTNSQDSSSNPAQRNPSVKRRLLNALTLYMALTLVPTLMPEIRQHPLFWTIWGGTSIVGLGLMVASKLLRQRLAQTPPISAGSLWSYLIGHSILIAAGLTAGMQMRNELEDIIQIDNSKLLPQLAFLSYLVLTLCLFTSTAWTIFYGFEQLSARKKKMSNIIKNG